MKIFKNKNCFNGGVKMIFRPIIIYSKQTETPSFFYYYEYHYTLKDIGKNLLCRGENCEICKHNIYLNKKFIIPIWYIKEKYINIKVLFENYSFAKKLFEIIKNNLDKFSCNDLMKEPYFINNFEVIRLDPTNYTFGKITIKLLNDFVKDFDENYLKNKFTDNKLVYDYYVKKVLKNKKCKMKF